jgi:pilus assembly protein Flp/PilA
MSLSNFLNDESGATAIEYGLIASLVSVAIISALGVLGANLSDTFAGVATILKSSTEAGSMGEVGATFAGGN